MWEKLIPHCCLSRNPDPSLWGCSLPHKMDPNSSVPTGSPPSIYVLIQLLMCSFCILKGGFNGMISKVWFSEKVSGVLWVWGFKDLLQGMGRNGGPHWHYQELDIYIYVEANFWQIQLYCLISNNKYFQPRFLFVKIVT